MSEPNPPSRPGYPGYKDLYDAVNALRSEFNASLKATEDRLIAELRAAESRRKEDAAEIKEDLQQDLDKERKARQELNLMVVDVRDQVLRFGAAFAVLVVIVNLIAPVIIGSLGIHID